MASANGFVREILFYFDPMDGLWILKDNAYLDVDYLDVDQSACFEEQYFDAYEYVAVIMQERGIDEFYITRNGQAWFVHPLCVVGLDCDDSENDDDFVWLQ